MADLNPDDPQYLDGIWELCEQLLPDGETVVDRRTGQERVPAHKQMLAAGASPNLVKLQGLIYATSDSVEEADGVIRAVTEPIMKRQAVVQIAKMCDDATTAGYAQGANRPIHSWEDAKQFRADLEENERSNTQIRKAFERR